jgi:hypothetical protein
LNRVKRCIELGLRDDPDESSDEEEQVPEGFTETVKSLTGWVDLEDNDTPPLLSLDNIHHYFVTKRLRRDEVTASKPFEKGYRIYHAKKVNSVSTHCVNEQSQYTIVRAAVSASQRDQVYKTCVAIHKNQGHVLYGYCTCIAGKCSTCNHVAALLFYSDNYNRERATTTQQQPSCTSLPCKWKNPSGVSTTQTVDQLQFEKPQLGHTPIKKAKFEPLDQVKGYVSIDRVMMLRKDLFENHTGTLGFHQVWPETTDIRQQAQLTNQFTRWHAVHTNETDTM